MLLLYSDVRAGAARLKPMTYTAVYARISWNMNRMPTVILIFVIVALLAGFHFARRILLTLLACRNDAYFSMVHCLNRPGIAGGYFV